MNERICFSILMTWKYLKLEMEITSRNSNNDPLNSLLLLLPFLPTQEI